jgi:hypothetical protein
MPASNDDLDGLEQVHELNRLFLHYLRSQAVARENCLGLPRQAIETLRSIAAEQLDRVAELPRALFSLRLGSEVARDRMMPGDTVTLRARQAMQLTILLSVWNCCRTSSYHARAFFGLSLETIRRLRMTPLSVLPEIAIAADLVVCAFSDSRWLWHRLLTETSELSRERLKLVALQPSISGVRPVPRNKRPR